MSFQAEDGDCNDSETLAVRQPKYTVATSNPVDCISFPSVRNSSHMRKARRCE